MTTLEQARAALDEVLRSSIEKIVDRAAADLATPDADLRAFGVTTTRQQMIRNMLRNLKTAIEEVAAGIDETFGAPS